MKNLEKEEERIVFEDDVLLFRFILLYVLADLQSKSEDKEEKGRVGFLIEQPAEPKNEPRCPSFWRTEEWQRLKQIHGLREVTFKQGDWGGRASKPTTVGTTMALRLPQERPGGEARGVGGGKPRWEMSDEEKLRTSKELSRWAPGMMREISRCLKWEMTRELPKMKKLSWEEHIKLGHLPYRRDCRVCQEASARDRPHRRLRHPEGNVLSVDLTGPFRYGRDTDDVEDKRYLLVATYTWPQVNVEEAEALPEGHREEDDSGHLPEPVEEIPEEEEAEESLEVEEGASPEAEEPIIPEREEPGPLKTLYFSGRRRRRRCWGGSRRSTSGSGGRACW